jgi:methionyl-tRNA formyltransferase
MNSKPRIIFFGTPEFAVASLKGLLDHGHQVVAVVTAPDKPAGRGLKPKLSAVKQFSAQHNIPVLQPVNLKDPSFLEELSRFRPDLQIIIAFRMLPEQVWSLPPLGTFNLHASLLPRYRGAAPIHWAVINGEERTGVTTFFLNDKIDAGHIIAFRETTVGKDETTGELHDRLMEIGASLVLETVTMIESGNFVVVDQSQLAISQDELKKAPKIFKDMCRISWDQPVAVLHNFIRGLSPFPGAFTTFTDPEGQPHDLKILRAHPIDLPLKASAGTVIREKQSRILFAGEDGWISVLELQLQGRKTMGSSEFLRGYSHFFRDSEQIS